MVFCAAIFPAEFWRRERPLKGEPRILHAAAGHGRIGCFISLSDPAGSGREESQANQGHPIANERPKGGNILIAIHDGACTHIYQLSPESKAT